jgi:hypothetical protein
VSWVFSRCEGTPEKRFCWRWTFLCPDAVELFRDFSARYSNFLRFDGAAACESAIPGIRQLANGEDQTFF